MCTCCCGLPGRAGLTSTDIAGKSQLRGNSRCLPGHSQLPTQMRTGRTSFQESRICMPVTKFQLNIAPILSCARDIRTSLVRAGPLQRMRTLNRHASGDAAPKTGFQHRKQHQNGYKFTLRNPARRRVSIPLPKQREYACASHFDSFIHLGLYNSSQFFFFFHFFLLP